MGRRKSGKPPKIRSLKKLVASGITPRQSRFAIAFAKTRNKTQSALLAGYSPKNAGQSGHQALEQLREKAPEVIARMGITLERVIEKNLIPLTEATETKFAQHEGEFKDFVDVADNGIRLGATRTMLELMGAFPKDTEFIQDNRITHVVIDVPRPDRSLIDVRPVRKTSAPVVEEEKPDPRPKD